PYRLRLASNGDAFADQVGNPLDGEPNNASVDGTPSGDGAPGGDYWIDFAVDAASLTAKPFERIEPLGGQASASRGNLGYLDGADDVDTVKFRGRAGQKVSIAATPGPAVVLSGQLVGVSGVFTATASGAKLILPSLTLPTDGDYEFRLSGDGAAAYEVELLSSGAFDSEPNDSRAAAQSLDAALLSSGAATGTSELAVVVGSLDALVGSGGSPTGPHAAGGGDDTVDWYSLSLSAGQTLSASLAGAGVVRLFNANGVQLAAGVDVSTDLAQAINGFVAPAAGTYFVQVADAEAGTSGDGDYTLVVGRGGDFEVEPNDRLAIAQRLEGAKSIAGWLNGTPPAAYQADAAGSGDGTRTDGDGGNQAGGRKQTGGGQRNGAQGDAVSIVDAARTRRGDGDVTNAGNSTGGSNGSNSSDNDADRRVIVRFDDGLPDELVEQWVASRGGRIVTRLHSVFNGAVVELPDSAAESTEVARDWSKAPNVEYAVADMRRSLAVVPDDPQFAQQWGFDNQGQTGGAADADVDASEAWDYVTGSADVVVAVIDTGIDYRHPDLAANMWVNPGEVPNNKLDDDGNGYVDDVYGIDAAADDSDPQDFFGHGTHVAGTIAAVTNNGIGVAGVNWNARVMAVKAFSDGGFAYDADLIEALDYVVMMKRTYGVNIVATNNSYGGGGFNPAMVDAIRASVDAGVLFVAAAGNASTDIDVVPFYPAGYALDGIVSVAATDHADHLAWFSNYGATGVDLAAPGDGILSTVPGGDYAVYSGTSMATPHVAGAAALLAANSPGASAADLKRALLQSVDFATDLDGAVATDGRLNLLRALQQLGDRGDYYRFKATAGDQLLLTTSTSTSADVAPDRQLDPALELFDSHGVLVASDDNSAADGRNSRLAFLATESGDYVVHVVSRANRGEYVLQLQGATGEVVAPIVVATTPLDAERVPSVPQRYTVDFSEAILVSSVQPSDLEFGGRPALAVEIVDGDTLSFTPDASVDTGADRSYDVTIAAGAMVDLQGVPNAALQATVFIDHTAPRVVATRWNGAAEPASRTFAEGPMSVEIQFNEPVRRPLGVAAWLWSDRFGFSITPISAILDAGGTGLHLDFESLAEGRYELKLASGDEGIQDLAGNNLDGEPSAVSVDGAPSGDGVAGGDFTASFEVDRTQVDARPMQRLTPAGSLIVESRFNDGWLNSAGDEDVYRVFAQQGETLAVSVVSTGDAIPAGLRVRIDGLTDWSSSPQPTDAAVAPPTRAPDTGYYFVRVTGDRAAPYMFDVVRNAAIEWPEGDSRANWPVAIAGSAIELETWASRLAVVGMSLPPGLVGGEKTSSIGPNVTEDLDQYRLDFTDSVGHSVDIVLASEFGVLGAERLELLDPTGVNVLAT
ncbi:MAG TPA: S8 family serine peptidase, partial [Pirellulaceae bacterium]|nr:S8 family serine peptidase [Pirellulaceae bacterium]